MTYEKQAYICYDIPMFNNYIKPAIMLIAGIIACSILVRVLSGNETLSDYAQKHPEIAYGGSNTSDSSNSDLSVSDGNSQK